MPGGVTFFWDQLRRRNVFKVGASYAVVAWIVLQAAGILLPTFGAPDWAMRVVVIALFLGLPAVLVFAWAFEITPEGLRRTSEVPEEQSIRDDTSRRLNYVLGGLLGAALLFIVVDQIWLDDAAPSVATAAPTSGGAGAASILPNSVAVLPLENLTPNADNAYIADGLHEEILNQLGKLKNLSVIARTSVLPYRENRPTIPEIARALNVESVMEGSVRYAGTRIRVTTQLIDASTGAQLWSETYDREFGDVFAIETDIAMNVANALRAEFSEEERRAIAAEPTVSDEAYALYLRARTGAPNVHALLDEAIRLDPRFALAYGFKARLYAEQIVNTTAGGGRDDWRSFAQLATFNAERALAIDPTVGVAYAALGTLHQRLWRWDEATSAFLRALEYSPIRDYSWHAAFRGDYAESVRLGRRRVELTPAVAAAQMDLGIALEYAGDLDSALQSHRAALAVSPGWTISRQHAGLLAARKGEVAVAAMDFETLESQFGGEVPVVFLPELAVGHALLGRAEDAKRFADRIFTLAKDREVGAGTLAMAYLAIGDADGAAAQLEIATARAASNEPDQGFFQPDAHQEQLVRSSAARGAAARGASRPSRPRQVVTRKRRQAERRQFGSANTHNVAPRFGGLRNSGTSGAKLRAWKPPSPTTIATYCLPSTA
jgi:adenylate cyclase